MDSDSSCLRCLDVQLELLPSSDDILFFRCPSCGRQFARTPTSGALCERWLGPLSIALYPVIFEQRPQDAAARVAALLRIQTPEVLPALVAEIQLEIAQPTQLVSDILPGMRASEADLREFLTLLANTLSPLPLVGP